MDHHADIMQPAIFTINIIFQFHISIILENIILLVILCSNHHLCVCVCEEASLVIKRCINKESELGKKTLFTNSFTLNLKIFRYHLQIVIYITCKYINTWNQKNECSTKQPSMGRVKRRSFSGNKQQINSSDDETNLGLIQPSCESASHKLHIIWITHLRFNYTLYHACPNNKRKRIKNISQLLFRKKYLLLKYLEIQAWRESVLHMSIYINPLEAVDFDDKYHSIICSWSPPFYQQRR